MNANLQCFSSLKHPFNGKIHQLPFKIDGFTWEHFERFFCDFLESGPTIEMLVEGKAIPKKLVSARRYGRPGDAQNGIDILAEVEGPEKWAFQCKHVKDFRPAQAQRAVELAKAKFPEANRYFLLLTTSVSEKTRQEVEKEPNWKVWGPEEITNHFLLDTPRKDRRDIAARAFGLDWAKHLFPLDSNYLISSQSFFEPWLQEGRFYHHRAAFLGREKELDTLYDFLLPKNETQILILSSRGGVGKTRLLREVSTRFVDWFPQGALYFINTTTSELPSTMPDTQATPLVLVHDDAHQSKPAKQIVAHLLKHPQTKLILAARPQAVEDLRAWLLNFGLESNRFADPLELKSLTTSQLEDLARSLLKQGFKHYAKHLALFSRHCAFITVMWAELMNQKEQGFKQLVEEKTLRDALFTKFEAQELAQIAHDKNVPFYQKLLRQIACLSPWMRDDEHEQQLSLWLHCSRETLQLALDCLQASGLLVKTREGLKITPDLFSDHLVYEMFYPREEEALKEGKDFIQNILKAGQRDLTNALQNLAEAEWRATSDNKSVASITDPLWDEVMKAFENSSFSERARRLGELSSMSFFLPKKSLELGRRALELKTPGSDINSDGAHPVPCFCTKEYVDAQVPHLVKNVALYHSEFRVRALNLMWEAGKKIPRPHFDPSNKSHPWDQIGEISQLRLGHSIEAPLEFLKWLENFLQQPEGEALLLQPNNLLSIWLSPLFAREVNVAFFEERAAYFTSRWVSVKKTHPLRQKALQIIQDHILPRGEQAVLNLLHVLQKALEAPGNRLGYLPEKAEQSGWLKERKQALQVLEKILDSEPSPLIQFHIRKILKNLMMRETSKSFAAACQKSLNSIKPSLELDIIRCFLSNHRDEFYLDREDSKTQNNKIAKQKWELLLNQTSLQLIQTYPSCKELLDYLSQQKKNLTQRDQVPSLNALLHSFSQKNPEIAEECVNRILAGEHPELSSSLAFFFGNHLKFPDIKLQSWVKQALDSQDSLLCQSGLSFLNPIHHGEIPKSLIAQVIELASITSEPCLLSELFFLMRISSQTYPKLVHTLLKREWSEDWIEKLSGSLGAAIKYQAVTLDREDLKSFLHQLISFHRLDQASDILETLGWIAKKEPRLVYDFWLSRIDRKRREHQRDPHSYYSALPWNYSCLMESLPHDPDYELLGKTLLQDIQKTHELEILDSLISLFQMAFLRVRPLGLNLLDLWIDGITDIDELKKVIRLLQFQGSRVVLEYPEFTKKLLHKFQYYEHEAMQDLNQALANTCLPTSQSKTSKLREDPSGQIKPAAQKALALYLNDEDLAGFYQRIVRLEEAAEAWWRQRFKEDTLEGDF